LAARRNPAILAEIADSLASIHGINRIEHNSATGSIVIHYDHRRHPDFQGTLTAHGETTGLLGLAPPELTEVDRLAENLEREAEFLAAHSETGRTIVDAVRELNAGLKRMTNNNIDLKV